MRASADNPAHVVECVGKDPLPSPQVAKKIVRRKKDFGVHLEAYRCKSCGFWHVGGGPKKPKLRKVFHQGRAV